ncbi:dirigent protein 10-like protein [Tanacetum coccineum]
MFGTLTVIDEELTEGHELGSGLIGKTQGYYVSSLINGKSQTMAFTVMFLRGIYIDSLSFMGVHMSAMAESQLAVMGGTGKYVNAKGHAIVKTFQGTNQQNNDDAVGSWFGGKGDELQGRFGTCYVTDQGSISLSLDKAPAFALENSFPKTAEVYGSYDAVLDDPDVEAVYAPLPTSIHLQWGCPAAAACSLPLPNRNMPKKREEKEGDCSGDQPADKELPLKAKFDPGVYGELSALNQYSPKR